MRLFGRRFSALIALSLAAPSISMAQTLDITGPYGNANGCKFAEKGLREHEDMVVLTPDRVENYATGCDFVEVLTAKDGSKIVTGICGYEGDEGIGTESFVITQSRTDPAGLTIYSSNGGVFGEVAPCP